MAQSTKAIATKTYAPTVVAHDFSVSFKDLCESAKMSSDYLAELVAYNIIKPITGKTTEDWRFSGTAVKVVNKAIRLHQDLEIEWADTALVVDLLDEIDQLESENRQLKKQMNRLLAFKL
jgi:chaperone modulatory protein CbpM